MNLEFTAISHNYRSFTVLQLRCEYVPITVTSARTRLEQLASQQEEGTTTVIAPTGEETSKMISQLIAELTEVQEILS